MKKLLAVAVISTIMLTGCSFTHFGKGIIKVNDKVITQADFDRALDKEIDGSMFKAFGGKSNFVKSDDNIMYLIYKEKVSSELIIRALLDSEIEKRGIKVTDEDIQNEMKSIIDKVGSKEELNKMLKQRGISNDDFNRDLKTQIRMKKLIDSIEKVKISDAETLKYYNEHPEQFKHEEQVRASHILVSVNTLELIQQIKKENKDITPEEMNKKLEQISAEKKAKAEKILKEVKANPDKFAELATKESDDKASGERGGELGFFSRKTMVPEFSNVAFSMKPNTISDLVKSPYGYHIIMVTDRIEAGTTPYAKVKEEIRFYLETEAQMKILKNLTDGLMKTAKIEYLDSSFNPENINKKAVKSYALNAENHKKLNGETK